ncbi:Nn.00g085080.m01.CDS01 [Neocucurbitaria sp. VM-36]
MVSISTDTSSRGVAARNTAKAEQPHRCGPTVASITANVSVDKAAIRPFSTHNDSHEKTAALMCDEWTTQIEYAWDLRKEVIIARETRDSYVAFYTKAESDANRSVDSTKADIKNLEARILRQPGSQTPEQTKHLRDLHNTLNEKKMRQKNIHKQKKMISKDLKEAEGRLLQALMEIQPIMYHSVKQTARFKETAPSVASISKAGHDSPREMSLDDPSQAGSKVILETRSTDPAFQSSHAFEHAREGNEPEVRQRIIIVADELRSPDLCNVTRDVSGAVTSSQNTKVGGVDHPVDTIVAISKPTLNKNTALNQHRVDPTVASLSQNAQKLHNESAMVEPPNAEKIDPSEPSTPNPKPSVPDDKYQAMGEVYNDVPTCPLSDVGLDTVIKEATSRLERREKHYWDVQRELEDHFESFDLQFARFETDNENMPRRVAEDAFGQVFTKLGREITERLNRAEEDLKEARIEARKDGVPDPNSWDQSSGFLSVEGEGPREYKRRHSLAFDEMLEREHIKDWLHTSDKPKILQPVEFEYATSGAEVDTWESSSSRGDLSKRRKIDACNLWKEVGSSSNNQSRRNRERSLTSKRRQRAKSEEAYRRKPVTSEAPQELPPSYEFTFRLPLWQSKAEIASEVMKDVVIYEE